MDYEYDQFAALVAEVERQGGALLPEKCEGTTIEYKMDKKIDKVRTCECGNETMLISTYEVSGFATKKKAVERGGGFVRACAVCDNVGEWARYAKALDD